MKYPVYVISKGRPGKDGLTARFLIRDETPFSLVIEPQEHDAYAASFGSERLLVLPFSNLGQGSIPARNWVWEHAKEAGHARHWILDDNIRTIYRRWKGRRIPCKASLAFGAVEHLMECYSSAAMAGLNYDMFCPNEVRMAPFVANCHVYSCLLIQNDIPMRWRGRYNEDTDLCLQVLSAGLNTVLVNAFLIDKVATGVMKGGNATELYQGDGRCTMARSLERMWPGVVQVKRRFGRPQHVVDWKRFKHPLRLREGVEPVPQSEHGMTLKQVKPIKSEAVREILRDYHGGQLPTPELGSPTSYEQTPERQAKKQARNAVRTELRAGRMKRQPCKHAGPDCSGRVSSHHVNGYEPAHWLDVEWLCRAHHDQEHKNPVSS
jgi:hypothetical protein